ncbi:hypothetical protein MPSEU_000298200 [Mayamaea pseudoterrestris]|nr:hypothetical protein MPSEU_000298200 [Mayamaea pseudoterrestris]
MTPQPTTNEMAPQERHAEIWATRVQRELLALTTDDSGASTATKAMLPPFVSLQSHDFDLGTATCTIDFRVEIMTTTMVKTVTVQLDVSLPKNADGSLMHTPTCYPFCEPMAKLLTGQEYFANGSTIQNGDLIAIDIEWTPSLHLADAIVNISLKIKESFLQGEPFHAAPPPELDPVQELEQSARRIASSAGKMASSLAKAVSALGSPAAKAPKLPGRKKQSRRKQQQQESASSSEVRMGQEINLLKEPWVDAHGVYSCKPIRRPDFIVDAIAHAEAKAEHQPGFSSPTAMFKSMTKKAGSVLQESFLMVTETHIIEMKSSKLAPTTATVEFCISIDLMHKLKFRRGESVSLFFKPAPEDPLIYMCPDSSDAVHQIQTVLRRHGVKGKHTNAAAHKAIQEAMHLVQEIQTKELALKHDPSRERVNEIMDLYRQAAERFELAGDTRHEEVVTHMRKFLDLPLTASIIDGTFKMPERRLKKQQQGAVPQGEILERCSLQLEDDDDIFSPVGKKPSLADRSFEDDIDDMLKEAEADLEGYKTSDTLATDDMSVESDGALADIAADLESMMKAADEELQELMRS